VESDEVAHITSFNPGTITYDREYVRLARGNGEAVKFLGSGGTDHEVTFKFLNVADGNKAGILNRIKAFRTYKSMGTLSIPTESFSEDNCVVDSVSAPTLEKKFIIQDNLTQTTVWNIEFTMGFRQLK